MSRAPHDCCVLKKKKVMKKWGERSGGRNILKGSVESVSRLVHRREQQRGRQKGETKETVGRNAEGQLVELKDKKQRKKKKRFFASH